MKKQGAVGGRWCCVVVLLCCLGERGKSKNRRSNGEMEKEKYDRIILALSWKCGGVGRKN